MPVKPQDKPLDALREETIDQLVMNYGHGKLSLNAFERRLERALDTDDHETLIELTHDLDLQVDAGFIEKKKGVLGNEYRAAPAHDVERIVQVLSAGDRSGNWVVPKEVQIFTVFGAADVDFSDARFSGTKTRVKLFCLFGAVNLFVREDIHTTVKTFCVLGAIDNKAPASDDPDAPQLVVEGLVVFGAAAVKVKKTFKERLLEFANGFRSMFGQST